MGDTGDTLESAGPSPSAATITLPTAPSPPAPMPQTEPAPPPGDAVVAYPVQTADGFVREGDEEVQYVVVDLPPNAIPLPGAATHIKGLDTAAPQLQLADGTWLRGQYETSLGSTLLLLDDTQQPDEGHGSSVRYLCHTERRLTFKLK